MTEALAGQGPLTKTALGDRLPRSDVPAAGQGIVHLAALGAFRGRVCSVPTRPASRRMCTPPTGSDRRSGPSRTAAAPWPSLPAATCAPGPGRAGRPRDLVRAAAAGRPGRFAGIAGELVEVGHAGGVLYRLRTPAAARGSRGLNCGCYRPSTSTCSAGGPATWWCRPARPRGPSGRRHHPPHRRGPGRVVGTWRLPGGEVVVDLFDAAAGPGLSCPLDAERGRSSPVPELTVITD